MTTTTLSFDGTTRKRTLRLLMSFLALFLAAAFFSACGKSDDGDETEKNGKSEKNAEEGQKEYQNGLAALKVDDFKEAVKSFRAGAEKGNEDAQILLGMCYERGRGVERDLEEALSWYRKAAKSENPIALVVLGQAIRDTDREKAIKYFKMSAEKGCVLGQVMLADSYLRGDYEDEEEDEEYAKKAMIYMKEAANQPLTDRKICLDYYNRADRIFSDDFEDYENISVTNIFIIGAQFELACYYYHDKDISEAKKWLERARKNGLSKHEYEDLKKNMR